jgi:hypothetical protein
MTSITMSKSPKHWVREAVSDARSPNATNDVLRSATLQVHKQILHLPIRQLNNHHEEIESISSGAAPSKR